MPRTAPPSSRLTPSPRSRIGDSSTASRRGTSAASTDVIEEEIYAEGVGVVLEITVSGGSDRAEVLSYRES